MWPQPDTAAQKEAFCQLSCILLDLHACAFPASGAHLGQVDLLPDSERHEELAAGNLTTDFHCAVHCVVHFVRTRRRVSEKATEVRTQHRS